MSAMFMTMIGAGCTALVICITIKTCRTEKKIKRTEEKIKKDNRIPGYKRN